MCITVMDRGDAVQSQTALRLDKARWLTEIHVTSGKGCVWTMPIHTRPSLKPRPDWPKVFRKYCIVNESEKSHWLTEWQQEHMMVFLTPVSNKTSQKQATRRSWCYFTHLLLKPCPLTYGGAEVTPFYEDFAASWTSFTEEPIATHRYLSSDYSFLQKINTLNDNAHM